MADNQLFTLKIITPDRVFYEGEASMVEFNTTEGEIGVYKMHVPTTVIVSPGVLTITEAEGQKHAALHAGLCGDSSREGDYTGRDHRVAGGDRSGSCRPCEGTCRRETSFQNTGNRYFAGRDSTPESTCPYSCTEISREAKADGEYGIYTGADSICPVFRLRDVKAEAGNKSGTLFI